MLEGNRALYSSMVLCLGKIIFNRNKVLPIIITPQDLIGRNFVGGNFRRAKLFVGQNSSLLPDEKFRPIKVKVSLVEVQVNLRG